MKRTKLAIIGCGILVSAIVYSTVTSLSTASNKQKNYEHYYNESEAEETLYAPVNNSSLIKEEDQTEYQKGMPLDTDPESITVFVNKEYSLPEDYIPKDLVEPNVSFSFSHKDEKRLLRKEAASALEDLFQAGLLEGHELTGVSGYRSFKRQNEIYNKNIKTKGLAFTELYSAKPGFSEHQTGLAIDISSKTFGYRLSEEFGSTPAGKWVNDHAHTYGFIIRYPAGKEAITGYSYEPWHIRYVGVGIATYLYENNLTFEEYFDYTPPVFHQPSYESSDEMDHITNTDELESSKEEPKEEKEETTDKDSKPTDTNEKEDETKPDKKPQDDNAKPNNTKPNNSKPNSSKPNNDKPEDSKPNGSKPEEDKPSDEEVKPPISDTDSDIDNEEVLPPDTENTENESPEDEQPEDEQPGNNLTDSPSGGESINNFSPSTNCNTSNMQNE